MHNTKEETLFCPQVQPCAASWKQPCFSVQYFASMPMSFGTSQHCCLQRGCTALKPEILFTAAVLPSEASWKQVCWSMQACLRHLAFHIALSHSTQVHSTKAGDLVHCTSVTLLSKLKTALLVSAGTPVTFLHFIQHCCGQHRCTALKHETLFTAPVLASEASWKQLCRPPSSNKVNSTKLVLHMSHQCKSASVVWLVEKEPTSWKQGEPVLWSTSFCRARPKDSSKCPHCAETNNFCIVMKTQSEASHHLATRLTARSLCYTCLISARVLLWSGLWRKNLHHESKENLCYEAPASAEQGQKTAANVLTVRRQTTFA